MPTLAIPGGTSASLGRSIVNAVLAKQKPTQWNLVILSRSTRTPTWLRALDPAAHHHAIRAVDYCSVDSLTSALQGVHTVISVTSAVDGTQAQTQINILNAAIRAGCKRFSPSQFGFGYKGWEDISSLQWINQGVFEECNKRRNDIEISYFNQGSFMNYLGMGIFTTPEPTGSEQETIARIQQGGGYLSGEDSSLEGLQRGGPLADQSGAFLVGLKSGIAELPVKSDGSWPRVTFTAMSDVGKFIAASLDLDKWIERMDMAGETLTMGELLRHAEDVTGKTFDVTTLEPAKIEQNMATLQQDDFTGLLWADFNLAYCRDREDETVLKPTLNALCPEIEPIGVREYLDKSWAQSK